MTVADEHEHEHEPAPTDGEREELESLEGLLSQAAHFDLSPSALARGRRELEQMLAGGRARKAPARRSWRLFWPLPAGLAAALLLWLVVRPPAKELSPPSPELATVQSHFLTSELTGAPVSRKELERATRRYRKDLLASLEATR